jgi:hypothetical protein
VLVSEHRRDVPTTPGKVSGPFFPAPGPVSSWSGLDGILYSGNVETRPWSSLLERGNVPDSVIPPTETSWFVRTAT